jgi:multidrug efflux pump subunit AcrA (membrane-fusion protein)
MLVLLVVSAARALGGESPAVKLVPAQVARARNRESVTGQLNASKLLPLGFEVGGRIAISSVTKGQVVKAGQPLGRLDTEIIDAQVAQAEAMVMAAEANSVLASDVASRSEQLKAEGSVSDVQSKQTEAQQKAAKAQLAQARLAWRRHGRATAARPGAAFAGTIIGAGASRRMTGPGLPVHSHAARSAAEGHHSRRRWGVKLGLKVWVSRSPAGSTDDAVVAVRALGRPQTRRCHRDAAGTRRFFVAAGPG